MNEKEIKEIDQLIDNIDYENQKPVKDGIVDLKQYKEANYKILWILKEPNDDKSIGGWDMRDFIADGLNVGKENSFKWRKSWKMIVYVTWGILNKEMVYEKKTRQWEEEQKSILQKIAFINLKKIPGTSSSSKKIIKEAFNKNKEIIFKQINVYKPDIIIFAGTNIFFDKSDFELIKKRRHKIIVTHHPNQRTITHKKYYESILSDVFIHEN